MNQIGKEDLRQILQEANTPSSYQGVVGSGSTTTAVVDSVGGWATNQWAQYGIQFTQTTVTSALRGVWQQITSNTGNTLTLAAALPAAPAEGDTYDIRVFGSQVQDVTAWGGQPVAAASDGYPQFSLAASTTLYDGQASVTATPAAIGSQAIREVILTADPTNAAGSYVYVGNSSSQHTPLAPGESITLSVSNLSLVYAYASTGTQKLDYLGRN